jgi:hypothetical protein
MFEWRVHVALWAAACALKLDGDFVECGVNAGFISSAVMRKLDWGTVLKPFYLIDTFAGPVMAQYSAAEIRSGRKTMAENNMAAGAYVTDVERVRANFSEWPGVVVVQGAVPEVLATLDVPGVAFLHIDLNCAYPERAALEYFWERISRAGSCYWMTTTSRGTNARRMRWMGSPALWDLKSWRCLPDRV